MRRMIRGKYDSLYKREFNVVTGKFTQRLQRGKFATAMQYACRVRGGVAAIQHIRAQPWETWESLAG
jgi:hypothetical protein